MFEIIISGFINSVTLVLLYESRRLPIIMNAIWHYIEKDVSMNRSAFRNLSLLRADPAVRTKHELQKNCSQVIKKPRAALAGGVHTQAVVRHLPQTKYSVEVRRLIVLYIFLCNEFCRGGRWIRILTYS